MHALASTRNSWSLTVTAGLRGGIGRHAERLAAYRCSTRSNARFGVVVRPEFDGEPQAEIREGLLSDVDKLNKQVGLADSIVSELEDDLINQHQLNSRQHTAVKRFENYTGLPF